MTATLKCFNLYNFLHFVGNFLVSAEDLADGIWHFFTLLPCTVAELCTGSGWVLVKLFGTCMGKCRTIAPCTGIYRPLFHAVQRNDGRWTVGIGVHESGTGEHRFSFRVKHHLYQWNRIIQNGSFVPSLKGEMGELWSSKIHILCPQANVLSFAMWLQQKKMADGGFCGCIICTFPNHDIHCAKPYKNLKKIIL